MVLLDLIEVSFGVALFGPWDSVAFFNDNGVVLSVNGGIRSNGEDVLVVLREDTWRNDVSVLACFSLINRNHGYNTSGSGLNNNASRLVELVSEDVLVISKRDDELDDKLAHASHDSAASSPV